MPTNDELAWWDQHQVKVRELGQVVKVREMGRAFVERTWRAELYQRVLDTPEGQRMLADLVETAGLLKVSQVDGDPHRTAFNEGRRALVLEILELVRWNALDIIKLSQARQTSSIEDA